MDLSIQALIMGLVQGLTEFLPVSSSGHLILVPWLFGWKDPFIDSLEFSVTLHMGTLLALLVFFWREWRRLIPAGLTSIRDRSLGGDPDRRTWASIIEDNAGNVWSTQNLGRGPGDWPALLTKSSRSSWRVTGRLASAAFGAKTSASCLRRHPGRRCQKQNRY